MRHLCKKARFFVFLHRMRSSKDVVDVQRGCRCRWPWAAVAAGWPFPSNRSGCIRHCLEWGHGNARFTALITHRPRTLFSLPSLMLSLLPLLVNICVFVCAFVCSGVSFYFMSVKALAWIFSLTSLIIIPCLLINTGGTIDGDIGLSLLAQTMLGQITNATALMVAAPGGGMQVSFTVQQLPALYSIIDIMATLLLSLGIVYLLSFTAHIRSVYESHTIGVEDYTIMVTGLERCAMCGGPLCGPGGCGSCGLCAQPRMTPESLANHFERIASAFTNDYKVRTDGQERVNDDSLSCNRDYRSRSRAHSPSQSSLRPPISLIHARTLTLGQIYVCRLCVCSAIPKSTWQAPTCAASACSGSGLSWWFVWRGCRMSWDRW